MNAKISSLALAAVLLPAVCSAQAASQPADMPRVEVVGSIAIGRVFRIQDQAFGNHPNLGAGATIRMWRRLHAGVDVDRTLGLTPTPIKCGSIYAGPGQAPLACVGSASEGPSGVTAASVAALYYFAAGRVQPYVLGGVSVMRSTVVTSRAVVEQGAVQYSSVTVRETGVGPTFGGGLRIAVTPALSVRTEMRMANGTALAASNLSQFRLSTGVGYAW